MPNRRHERIDSLIDPTELPYGQLPDLIPPLFFLEAECYKQGIDPVLFFPMEGGASSKKALRPVYETCEACPVREECLEYALENNEYGIWGGTSRKERQRIRRQRRKAAKAAS